MTALLAIGARLAQNYYSELPEHIEDVLAGGVEFLDAPHSVDEDRVKALRHWTAPDFRSALDMRAARGDTIGYRRLAGPARRMIAKLESTP